MGKISPVSGKYIVHATIEIDGVVDRPDVIGAIFGQTEGLLGSELELRELQRSGRIGRIEVNTDVKSGKTIGEIIIPSSMDKAETAIIGAALEIIERIGPCNAHIKIKSIEDIRITKRQQVVDRAKELLKSLVDDVMPDSQEIADEVAASVRMMEMIEWGPERLAAGPGIEENEEIIIVEGRADVVNLLKNGFKNVIAMNGSNVPKSIIPLCEQKTVTVFVDGDRGGDLIIKEITGLTEVDFVTKAPDGKEVEELTKKEIHKSLRGKVAVEQALMDISNRGGANRRKDYNNSRDNRDSRGNRDNRDRDNDSRDRGQNRTRTGPSQSAQPVKAAEQRETRGSAKPKFSPKQKTEITEMLENLVGTHGAFLLDEKVNVLGKIPKTELESTIKSVGKAIYAVVVDGSIEKDVVDVAEKNNITCVIGMDVKAKSTRTELLTPNDL